MVRSMMREKRLNEFGLFYVPCSSVLSELMEYAKLS